MPDLVVRVPEEAFDFVCDYSERTERPIAQVMLDALSAYALGRVYESEGSIWWEKGGEQFPYMQEPAFEKEVRMSIPPSVTSELPGIDLEDAVSAGVAILAEGIRRSESGYLLVVRADRSSKKREVQSRIFPVTLKEKNGR